MKFKIHDSNLQTIWDCLNAGYPEVWIHGSGDVFPVYVYDPLKPGEQDHSKNHAEQFNRGHEENSYRVKISKANMPKSIKELEQMLVKSKMNEEAEKENVTFQTNGRVTNIRQSDTDFRADTYQPAGEIDYSKFNKANA